MHPKHLFLKPYSPIPPTSDRIDFAKAIPAGTLAELVGRVVKIGTTSLKVDVEIFVEQMYADFRELAVKGSFTFVAVDESRNPVKVIPEGFQ